MTRLREFQKHLEQMTPERQLADIATIMEKDEPFIVDLNTQQLKRGLNSEGRILGKYKTKSYKKLKEYLNPAAKGNVDLFLEGDFQGGFFMEVERRQDDFILSFNSHDWKTGKLSEGYDNIFGISKESKKVLGQHERPQILEYYRTRVYKL